MSAPDPYARSTIHGKLLDNATIAAVRQAEHVLGYELTIYQGIGGATASAGTHLEGRVVDFSDARYDEKLPVLKRIGFAIWRRPYRPGVWAGHLHGALIYGSLTNQKGIADAAYRQIVEYLAGGDGLIGNEPDLDPWRADPQPVFTLADYRKAWANQNRPPRTDVTRARNRLREAIGQVEQSMALLDNVDPARVVAKAQLERLRAERADLQQILDKLPPR